MLCQPWLERKTQMGDGWICWMQCIIIQTKSHHTITRSKCHALFTVQKQCSTLCFASLWRRTERVRPHYDKKPKHTSKLLQNYLKTKEDKRVLTLSEFPPSSLDLNHTEHLWGTWRWRTTSWVIRFRQIGGYHVCWVLLLPLKQEERQSVRLMFSDHLYN